MNGDGKVTVDDRTIINNPTPKILYGASINFNFHGFNLGIDLVGDPETVLRTWGHWNLLPAG